MAPVQDPDLPLVVQFRPMVVVFKRRQGQGSQHVQPRQGMGRILDFRNHPTDLVPDLIKQVILQGLYFFFGA